MSRSDDNKRGYEDGAKVQSASEEIAQIFTAPIQNKDYLAGFAEGQQDYADGKA